MSDGLSEAIRNFAQEKGHDDDFVLDLVEQALKAAYKKQFGTDSNAVFNRDSGKIYSQKTIVDFVEDDVLEISLEDAKKLVEDCEIGDELLVEVDPKSFKANAVLVGKQRVNQFLREMQKDALYTEYKTKIGEIIIGYYHREKNGHIYVDLGKVEGLLPQRFQSPRDHFGRNTAAGEEDRIKALVKEVKKHRKSNVVQLILSRTDTEFVRKIMELEIPEIENGIVEIHNIVREAGQRTKIAVSSSREDIDPVGACVGAKGVRIQAVITELENEKIDILPYSDDPAIYIRNALSPAEVINVIITDYEKRSALAIVADSQLSLAIGKQGVNVRLANRLVDWNIEVKTEEQFKEMDIYSDQRRAAEALFVDEEMDDEYQEMDDEYEEISSVSELPGITEEIIEVLRSNDKDDIQELINMTNNEIKALEGMSEEMAKELIEIIATAVEVVEEDDESYEEDELESSDEAAMDASHDYVEEKEIAEQDLDENEDKDELNENEETEGDEELECPECGHPITVDISECPNCGIELVFEYEEEEE